MVAFSLASTFININVAPIVVPVCSGRDYLVSEYREKNDYISSTFPKSVRDLISKIKGSN
tara:strand:+ start:996 stop:1175 length:180 start_codon:yes stop_codon:yes gene_type:complete